MIRYNYLGSGNFKYNWQILGPSEVLNKISRFIDLEMWDKVYGEMCKKYFNFPYYDEYVADRIRTRIKILILILTTKIPGASSGNIKIERNNIINLQAEFWDNFRIYVQANDTAEETVYIDYRDDNNETIYKGNLSLIDLDTLLNDTTI